MQERFFDFLFYSTTVIFLVIAYLTGNFAIMRGIIAFESLALLINIVLFYAASQLIVSKKHSAKLILALYVAFVAFFPFAIGKLNSGILTIYSLSYFYISIFSRFFLFFHFAKEKAKMDGILENDQKQISAEFSENVGHTIQKFCLFFASGMISGLVILPLGFGLTAGGLYTQLTIAFTALIYFIIIALFSLYSSLNLKMHRNLLRLLTKRHTKRK
ncbi:MAG: hypothetical protein Q7R70_03420 [Candidatus Diapherotrites archaeon]|nr:hypothetical protein [Candidatus Diapherotrites archaeon]